MAYVPFNDEKDKVSEREMVYDIVERMTLGKDLTEGSNVLWRAKTFITDIWKKLAYMLPPIVSLNILKVKVGIIEINAGSTSGSVTITDLEHKQVLLAVSQQNGCDLKDCLTISTSDNNIVCSLSVDAPFLSKEYIKVYAY